MDKAIPTFAIVGGESLLGREMREVFAAAPVELQLIGADEEDTGRIVEQGGEPTVLTPLDEANLASADLVILAGSAASSRKTWDLLEERREIPVIDATHALEDLPSARLRAPLANPGFEEPASPVVIAHPAAAALAVVLSRLETFGIVHVLAEIFEPASERGQAGIDELHQQTRNLFAFQPLPKELYDAQLAYAMLSRYGLESAHSLEQVELRIERHLATLLSAGGSTHLPSLRLIQAPVFHGYSMSVWAQIEEAVEMDVLLAELEDERIDLHAAGAEAPTNVTVAGESKLAIGNIRPDRNRPRAFWIWLAADNLRITAENALRCAEELCGTPLR